MQVLTNHHSHGLLPESRHYRGPQLRAGHPHRINQPPARSPLRYSHPNGRSRIRSAGSSKQDYVPATLGFMKALRRVRPRVRRKSFRIPRDPNHMPRALAAKPYRGTKLASVDDICWCPSTASSRSTCMSTSASLFTYTQAAPNRCLPSLASSSADSGAELKP